MHGLCMLAKVIEARKGFATVTSERPLARMLAHVTCEMLASGKDHAAIAEAAALKHGDVAASLGLLAVGVVGGAVIFGVGGFGLAAGRLFASSLVARTLLIGSLVGSRVRRGTECSMNMAVDRAGRDEGGGARHACWMRHVAGSRSVRSVGSVCWRIVVLRTRLLLGGWCKSERPAIAIARFAVRSMWHEGRGGVRVGSDLLKVGIHAEVRRRLMLARVVVKEPRLLRGRSRLHDGRIVDDGCARRMDACD